MSQNSKINKKDKIVLEKIIKYSPKNLNDFELNKKEWHKYLDKVIHKEELDMLKQYIIIIKNLRQKKAINSGYLLSDSAGSYSSLLEMKLGAINLSKDEDISYYKINKNSFYYMRSTYKEYVISRISKRGEVPDYYG